MFNAFEFTLITFCAFIADFDIFFITFTEEDNHRMFISHSIFPSILLFTIGIIFNSYFIIICGIAYLSHVLLDTLDWGTNMFFFGKKIIGFKFLISKEENDNLKNYLEKFKVARSFFDFKYYESKLIIALELLIFVIMVVFILSFALEFILTVVLYFIGFFIHMFTHYRLKTIEKT